jgi:hypothetical protein
MLGTYISFTEMHKNDIMALELVVLRWIYGAYSWSVLCFFVL